MRGVSQQTEPKYPAIGFGDTVKNSDRVEINGAPYTLKGILFKYYFYQFVQSKGCIIIGKFLTLKL